MDRRALSTSTDPHPASYPLGWDRRDPRTLRFRDGALERSYQYAEQEQGVRRVRTAALVAAGVWALVQLLGPISLGIAPGTTWPITGAMVVLLVSCAVASRWATTPARRDAIGLGQQVAAAVACIILTAVTGTFATYAMPAVMLTAVFGFGVTRPPFVGSMGLGVFYFVTFLLAAVMLRLGPPLPLQAAIVGATVVAASVGAYLLERSQREAFAQGRLIRALHERVDGLLRQYLSPDVARSLIDDPARAALGGEVVDVTVLFADLRGYTTFAERATPREVVGMLNAAFGAAVPVVLAEGGTVVQFIGDALMAIFNAPNPQPDHELRAVRAALSMQRAVNDLVADLDSPLTAANETDPRSATRPATRPRFRVGVATGPALIGNIGAAEIRNFSAIGDTTNLAARLQTFAAEGSVVIGASTYARIREQVVVRPLGTPQLKGKSQAVEVYELLGLRTGSSPP